mmetsp:Transcript_36270/g.59153  ORF Transcript_36270/g.59153 Transcript_36270/m.59153 type:complete len:205 (+) Transcript_36270:1728-2342(+)
MEDETCSRSFNGIATALGNGVRARSVRCPLELLRIGLHRLGHDLHLIRHQVRRVKSNSELTNQVDIRGTLTERLHELLGARLRNFSEIVHEFRFGHAHARVFDGDGHGLLVRFDLNGGPSEGFSVGVAGEGEEAFLVAGVGGVGYELAEEDVAVGVEGVDDNVHDASDFRLEFKSFSFLDSLSIYNSTIRHGQRAESRSRCSIS